MELLANLVVAILLQIPVGIVTMLLADRKGKGTGVKVLGFVPGVGCWAWMYVVGLTDEQVLYRLQRIDERLRQAAKAAAVEPGS